MSQTLDRAESVAELRAAIKAMRARGETLAIVPTMGALHDGHIALVEQARSLADRVVVSIFVNPTQFAPNEDFSRYPRTLDADLARLTAARADLVYLPAAEEMYPPGFATRIVMEGPAAGLETDFRPNFFSGVAIVVTKLFTQTGADVAVFGEKDYQQLKVVTRMARDLDLPIRVVPGPTVREADGVALSSRNKYLSEDERAIAPVIFRSLSSAAIAIRDGAPPAEAVATARQAIGTAGLQVDYVVARHADTLVDVTSPADPIRLLAAAWLGKTRLIDNIAV